MKRLFLFLAALLVGLAVTALPRPAATGGPTWPPLLNCPDVTGTGSVAVGDIFQIVARFGTHIVPDSDGYYVAGPGYLLLYDVDGGGQVAVSDIFQAVGRFGEVCPLVETQVAQATLATIQYADCQDAVADGFISQTQYVPTMGIHMSKLSNIQVAFDPGVVFGLICKEAPGGGPDELIGLWYIVPVPSTCWVYFTLLGLDPTIDPATCPEEEPEGFDGPEDNTDLDSVQRGWHTHINLCVGPGWVIELGPTPDPVLTPAEVCANVGGLLNIPTYGWMVHLYNMIPNVDGRFMMWNYENLP